MDMRQITPRFFAAPQISPEDMSAIAQAGITRVLCNRPDAEVPPSHQAAAMEQAARAAGLEYVCQPLTHQTMTPEIIMRNRELIKDCEGKVLAYCASGTRSTIAWALGAAREMTADDIIAAAGAGGYDLRSMRPILQEFARL